MKKLYIIKPREIKLFMDIAERVAQMSYAERLKVGCVIVKDRNIISMSWNGTPSGWDNCCEDYDTINIGGILTLQQKTKPEVLHAEENSILKLAREGKSGKDATMFCTHAPCIHCARMIGGAGISSLYYRNIYRDDSGIEYLKKYGTEIIHVS